MFLRNNTMMHIYFSTSKDSFFRSASQPCAASTKKTSHAKSSIEFSEFSANMERMRIFRCWLSRRTLWSLVCYYCWERNMWCRALRWKWIGKIIGAYSWCFSLIYRIEQCFDRLLYANIRTRRVPLIIWLSIVMFWWEWVKCNK